MTGLAVDIGGSKTAVARFQDGRITSRLVVKTQGHFDFDNQLDAVGALLGRLEFQVGEPVAFAVTGRVDNAGYWYTVNAETLTSISGAPLGKAVVSRFGSNFVVMNDVAASALGEAKYGAGSDVENMAFISVSTGIGGGFIFDGKLHSSRSGLAGHVGFMSSPIGNLPCGSGRFGTVESIASGTAIARQAEKATGVHTPAPVVFESWRKGEDWATEIVERSARCVAELCADLTTALGLDRVVFGGSVGLATGYLDIVRQHLSSEPDLFRVDLVPAALGANSPLYGALVQLDTSENLIL